jgi:transposase
MAQIYGLEISEGGIANLLKTTKQDLKPTITEIVEKLRSSEQVNSDETSARVRGKNEWEWVFQNREVCYHVIEPSRGGKVIQQVMAGHEPEVWGSDLFSSQKTHPGKSWQVCLAHQIRDCQYAIDQGDEILAGVMQKLFWKAIELHRRRDRLPPQLYDDHSCQIKKSDWGKELFANIRSIINTGKRQGLSALSSIRVALDPRLSLFSPS